MSKNDMQSHLLKFSADPDSTLLDEIGQLASKHLNRIEDLINAAKAGDTEAVHDMRIAVRRLRALIRVERNHRKDKTLKPLAQFAKVLCQSLDAVRNDDVLTSSLNKMTKDDAIHTLALGISLRRTDRVDALTKLLQSAEFTKWQQELQDHFANSSEFPKSVQECAEGALTQAYKSIRPHYKLTCTSSLTRIHHLRIDTKKFRYILEFFAKCTSHDVEPMLSKLIELQDHLGSLHDADLLLNQLQSAKAMKNTWRSEDREELRIAEKSVRRQIIQLKDAAQSKWTFLFDQSLSDLWIT